MRDALSILALGVVMLVLVVVIGSWDAITGAMELLVAGFVIFVRWMAWLVLVGVGVAALVGLSMLWRRQRDRLWRERDGSFALMQFRGRGGQVIVVDPNLMISGAGVFDPEYGWTEFEPRAGWDRQLAARLRVEATHMLQASNPGDDAVSSRFGSMFRGGRGGVANAATGRLLAGAYDKADRVIEGKSSAVEAGAVISPRATVRPEVLIDEAQPSVLILGQDVRSGSTVTWDLESFPFARLHGATQSGKTSLARYVVTQALRQGFEVVIYDRRRGKDWGPFRGHAEIVDVRDPGLFSERLAGEVERYQQRDALLGQAGAPNLEALRAATGQAPRRRLVVIEELGVQTVNAKAAGSVVEGAVVGNLRRLTAESGATGIHGLYIDQIPDLWDKAVRYNCSAVICFHLPDHGGQVAGYQPAHRLEPFHCHFDGQIVRAGFLDVGQIGQALGGAGRSPEVSPLRSSGGANAGRTVVMNAPAGGVWDGFAQKFFEVNPDASQGDLARALACEANDGRGPGAFKGGLTMYLFHMFSPRGDRGKL